MIKAFLLTRQCFNSANGIRLELWFSSDQGPIQVIIDNQQAVFFIQQQDSEQAKLSLAKLKDVEIKPLALKSFKQRTMAGVYFKSQQQLYRARDLLQQQHIPCFEADIRPPERFLTERFITGPVSILSAQSTHNTGILSNPKIKPDKYQPTFNIMSLDIETAYDTDQLYSIAFLTEDTQRVLMIGDENNNDYVEYLADESALLKRFMQYVADIDPDVFIGWNVINFDFRFLQKKADKLRIALNLGRHNKPISWRQAQTEAEHYFILIPGRVVLDGIDTLKSATYQFDSFSLESVGHQLLGRGKLIKTKPQQHDPLYKAKEIKRQFMEDKQSLAAYNLEDCQLVWDIFVHTDLVSFAIERARLTGLEMDRIGGSVAAFDNLYLPRLHRKGYIAPNIGDYHGSLIAPGGYVMDSLPGLYDSVLVLDYKSLYPSIIRTFKVDPYARIVAKQDDNMDVIPGFNGASFSKQENILPGIIEELWQARDRAKQHNNKALSQAIKIIMNSFYGVLGTPGCRVHDARLTSSITLRSHELIKHTVELIEQEGYKVIYGDTDSVFVSLLQQLDNDQANQIGQQLVNKINAYWQQHLHQDYGIDSYLEMEYETHFKRFFMPTARGSDKGTKKRYAGLVNNNGEEHIIFKGLETVRTDWTQMARQFQQELYWMIFHDQPYEDYIRHIVDELKQGKRDEQLVYRKRLRQKLNNYQKNVPPHAKAAMKAEQFFKHNKQPSRYINKGWIEYVMTVNGPETLECQSSPLDYQHYIDKQLTPIADNILLILGTSMEPIIQDQYQLF
ncbi:MAG: DNA polymerase II [Gammaproteobacteria bacterium]